MSQPPADPRRFLADGAQVLRLQGGYQFLEGPVWVPVLGGLLFSDIPADRLYLWRPNQGVSVFRAPSQHANGNTLDTEGRLITCEHGSRRVTRTTIVDGAVTVLAERYQGRRLNSPNDVTVQRDGTVWFTDPPYGIRPEEQELPGCYVFALSPDGDLRVVADDFVKPNGICFSPDESSLYVSDTANDRHHIRRFRVTADKRLEGGEVLAVIAPGKSDGFRVDSSGRIFTSAGDGIWVLSPDGERLGMIPVPETPANCAFGGVARNRLYVTARTSLYAVDLCTSGAGVA